MNDNQLDDLFRAGRRDREGDPVQASWLALSERLDAFDQRRHRNTRRLRAAAAVLLMGGLAAGFALFNHTPDNTAHQARASEKTITVPQSAPAVAANGFGEDRIDLQETKPAATASQVPDPVVTPENAPPVAEETVPQIFPVPTADNPGNMESGTALRAYAETTGAAPEETMSYALERENFSDNQAAVHGAMPAGAEAADHTTQRANAKQRLTEPGDGSAQAGYLDPLTAIALQVWWPEGAGTPCSGTTLLVTGNNYRAYPCGDLNASAEAHPLAGTVLEQMLRDKLRRRLEAFAAPPDCPDSPHMLVTFADAPDNPVRLPLGPDCLPDDLRRIADAVGLLARQAGP